MFASEDALTQVFDIAVSSGDTPFSTKLTAREFNYGEGRTDMVAFSDDGCVFAFEMKLAKWKQALHQAYRNTSFAHFSYVVLPKATAKRAVRWKLEFERRGVGLCSVDCEEINIEIEARRLTPLRPWLTDFAITFLAEGSAK